MSVSLRSLDTADDLWRVRINYGSWQTSLLSLHVRRRHRFSLGNVGDVITAPQYPGAQCASE